MSLKRIRESEQRGRGSEQCWKSRMASRERQGFVEDESRSKTKLKEVGDGMEGKIDHRDSRN